ncbi:hypothetical protein AHF37_04943 [Paragonimus kellicotti]|nr:hypothetical protein AHF37_04943 [Paragonimus kellicotti]
MFYKPTHQFPRNLFAKSLRACAFPIASGLVRRLYSTSIGERCDPRVPSFDRPGFARTTVFDRTTSTNCHLCTTTVPSQSGLVLIGMKSARFPSYPLMHLGPYTQELSVSNAIRYSSPLHSTCRCCWGCPANRTVYSISHCPTAVLSTGTSSQNQHLCVRSVELKFMAPEPPHTVRSSSISADLSEPVLMFCPSHRSMSRLLSSEMTNLLTASILSHDSRRSHFSSSMSENDDISASKRMRMAPGNSGDISKVNVSGSDLGNSSAVPKVHNDGHPQHLQQPVGGYAHQPQQSQQTSNMRGFPPGHLPHSGTNYSRYH